MYTGWIIAAAIVGGFSLLGGIGILVAHLIADKCSLPGIEEFDPKRIPIHLMPGHDIGTIIKDALRYAISYWNNAVGEDLFVPLGELVAGGSVVVVGGYTGYESTVRKNALAYVNLTLTENRLGIASAAIYIDLGKVQDLKAAALNRAVAHELGHALGLAHDDIEGSVMYKKALSSEAYVTKNDVEFLKDVYQLGVSLHDRG